MSYSKMEKKIIEGIGKQASNVVKLGTSFGKGVKSFGKGKANKKKYKAEGLRF